MWWIVLLIIVVIVAFVFPKFGKGLLIITAVLVAIGVIWYLNNQHEEEKSKKLISPSEILLENLNLKSSYGAESFRLLGRIKNNSKRYSLKEIRIKVTMRDCIKPGECEIVGENTAWAFLSVPPGQVRDIDESVYFSGLAKPKGKYEWDYAIIEIKGNK